MIKDFFIIALKFTCIFIVQLFIILGIVNILRKDQTLHPTVLSAIGTALIAAALITSISFYFR